MKKFISGLIIGIILMSSIVVFADIEEVVARFADFNLKLNNEKVELENKPLVVDGSSYLPVREIANLLNHDVDFNDKTNTILLDKVVLQNEDDELSEETEEVDVVVEEGQTININKNELLKLGDVKIKINKIKRVDEYEDYPVNKLLDYTIINVDIHTENLNKIPIHTTPTFNNSIKNKDEDNNIINVDFFRRNFKDSEIDEIIFINSSNTKHYTIYEFQEQE